MAKKAKNPPAAARALESPLEKKVRVDAEIKLYEKRVWKALTGANIATAVLVLANIIYRQTKQREVEGDPRFAAMTCDVLNRTIIAISGGEAPIPGEKKIETPDTQLIVADAIYSSRRRN
jgi:hypothetical protein